MTDDEVAWNALSDELVVYRAESNSDDSSRGFSWTLDREIAEMHAFERDPAPLCVAMMISFGSPSVGGPS
ncbi:hypothetical protein BH18ACT12_BH18ACT12_17350 [soil metagenome]